MLSRPLDTVETLRRALSTHVMSLMTSDAALFEGIGDVQDGGLLYASDPSSESIDLAGKRGRGNELNAPGAKRTRMDVSGSGDDYILKLLVSNHMVGSIIGKQGVVVKSIMDQSGTRIKVSETDEVLPRTGERVLTITGSLVALDRAQQLVSLQLAEAKPGEEPKSPDISREIKMLVPNIAAGLVIGKAGSVIKEIMERSGATIKVSQPSEVIAATQERMVTVSGHPQCVDTAQNIICGRLAEAPPSQQPKLLDYSVLKQSAGPVYSAVPATYATVGQGFGFSSYPPPSASQQRGPHELSRFGSCGVPVSNGLAPTGTSYGRSVGAYGSGSLYGCGGSHSCGSSLGGGSSYGEGGGGGGGGGGNASAVMSLPDKTIAGIIGRGGSIIKEISSRSGAQVSVSLQPCAPCAEPIQARGAGRALQRAMNHRPSLFRYASVRRTRSMPLASAM